MHKINIEVFYAHFTQSLNDFTFFWNNLSRSSSSHFKCTVSMITDKKLLIDVLSEPVSSYSDGKVCFTVAQFYNIASYDYKLWSSLESKTRDDSSISCTADCILNLLRHVLAFCAQRSKAFSILNKSFSQVKYALKCVTTTDAICDQSMKRTYHYQTLEILKSLSYRFIEWNHI